MIASLAAAIAFLPQQSSEAGHPLSNNTLRGLETVCLDDIGPWLEDESGNRKVCDSIADPAAIRQGIKEQLEKSGLKVVEHDRTKPRLALVISTVKQEYPGRLPVPSSLSSVELDLQETVTLDRSQHLPADVTTWSRKHSGVEAQAELSNSAKKLVAEFVENRKLASAR